ncbi:MAG TPA: hypothetical protein VFK76_00365 [Gaiellaceae bacterium]|nr:hypothetical protein [Gaiellaceae bacterium]
MGLLSVVDRLAERFTRWFGSTAGASAGAGAQTGNPEVDILAIKTVYPEIDHSDQPPEHEVGRTKKPGS